MLDRAKTAQILQIPDIDMPVIDLIATLAQQVADHVLARSFGATGRRDRNKIHRRCQLRIKAGIDGVENFLFVSASCGGSTRELSGARSLARSQPPA